jgi:MarR-like DNA-binding transcriptional regulator SgrR of sgrS sRNA
MGKSSAPAAPNYEAAAERTAAGNLEAAKYATRANRVNQYTPYGNLTYQENDDGTWSQTQTLTPQAQATLDKQMQLSDKYADTASQGFDKVQGLLANPQLDMSQLPSRAINVGQTAQDAIMSRLRPQLDQQDEALRTRLANQGITLGSDAYGKEMTAQGQRSNDMQMQAALQGISLDQANRASALQEQAYIQDRPLNLVNALRSGAQVQSPQFQGYAQQGQTGGADYSGAANQQYSADLANYNATQASNPMNGLFSLGGTVLGLGTGGGATVGGSLFNSLMGSKK